MYNRDECLLLSDGWYAVVDNELIKITAAHMI